jgi:hypothetical protein
LNGEHGARLDRQTVRQYGAGAADARLTADVRSGQTGDIANKVSKQKTRLNVFFIELTINCDFHAHT